MLGAAAWYAWVEDLGPFDGLYMAVITLTTVTDAENTFIVLTARALTPNLTITARAISDAAVPRLEAARADHVISPYRIAGERMAEAALGPHTNARGG